MSKGTNRKPFFLLILSLILSLHIVVLLIHMQRPELSKKSTEPKKSLEVRLIEDFKVRKQIVRSEDSKIRKIVDDAFLSDKNRYFDKQTKARETDLFQGKKRERKKLSFSDLGEGVKEDPFKNAGKNYRKNSTSDYLKDIPPGDATNLNTAEYKYYGFYHRIRQKLEGFWGRSIHEKAHELAKNGRQVAESTEYITALRITLNQKGEIIDIEILGASGVKELDDAAIESFNEAGPFPNPPKGLLVNGRAVIEWGFVVKSG